MPFLNEKMVCLDVEVKTAEEAIHVAGQLMVEQNKVTPEYVKAMQKSFQEIGPYFVVAPLIAIPHARPEHGVLEQCLSVIRLKKPVKFGHPTNDPVQLVCAIGGIDRHRHLQMLQVISLTLGDSVKLQKILQANTPEEIIRCFNY